MSAALIKHFLAARTAGRPVPASAADDQLTDLDDGYALQAELNRDLTALKRSDVAGYKIGCTTPVMQAYLKIPYPCSGVIFEDDLYASGTEIPHGRFIRPGIEVEIAVTMAQDLRPENVPYDIETLSACVASCHAAIEIVDDRYADFSKLTAATLVADNFFQAGEVLGPAIAHWREIDLAGVEGTVQINGKEAGKGKGALILGHPLNALVWLANSLGNKGQTLRKGQIVSLGSVVQTIWIDEPDTEVRVTFEGLGDAVVTFV